MPPRFEKPYIELPKDSSVHGRLALELQVSHDHNFRGGRESLLSHSSPIAKQCLV